MKVHAPHNRRPGRGHNQGVSKILLLSVSVGVGVWALDAVLDYLILGNRSFLDVLLFDVPLNSFCIRMVILSLVGFG